MSAKEFAVIQFADEGFEVIRTNWAVFDKSDTIIASYFPNVTSQKEINDLLQKNPEKDEVVTWTDEKGKPWPVKTVCCYAQTFKESRQKPEYHTKLSDVDSDDSINMDNFKKSRHLRCAKQFSEDDSEMEVKRVRAFKLKKGFLPAPSAVANFREKCIPEGENHSKPKFAVIRLQNQDTFDVIRTNWAVFNDSGKIVSTLFPDLHSDEEIDKVLITDEKPDATWADENGEPWIVQTFAEYANTFPEAMAKMKFYSDKLLHSERTAKVKEIKTENTFIPTPITANGNGNLCAQDDHMVSKIMRSEASYINLEQYEHVKKVAGALENRNSETRFPVNVPGQKVNVFKDITNDDNLRNPNVRPHRSGHGSSRFKDSPEDLECFDKAQMLMLMKINTMGVMLESFCRNNGSAPDKPSSVSFTKKDTDLEMFPARSISEIEKIEKKMTHKQFFDKVVSTWLSVIFWIIFVFCAVDIVDPDATIALATKSVKDWLYQCKNRQKREGENAKKAEEREKNMQLHLEEDVEEDDS